MTTSMDKLRSFSSFSATTADTLTVSTSKLFILMHRTIAIAKSKNVCTPINRRISLLVNFVNASDGTILNSRLLFIVSKQIKQCMKTVINKYKI